jgi:hypothetical protein
LRDNNFWNQQGTKETCVSISSVGLAAASSSKRGFSAPANLRLYVVLEREKDQATRTNLKMRYRDLVDYLDELNRLRWPIEQLS